MPATQVVGTKNPDQWPGFLLYNRLRELFQLRNVLRQARFLIGRLVLVNDPF